MNLKLEMVVLACALALPACGAADSTGEDEESTEDLGETEQAVAPFEYDLGVPSGTPPPLACKAFGIGAEAAFVSAGDYMYVKDTAMDGSSAGLLWRTF